MPTPPTLLIVGATGAQGGSVAHHLLAQGRFTIRALTRHPDAPPARALADAGAPIVRGDLADPPSLDAALAGCHGLFGVTNFWEHFQGEREHGRNLVHAVARARANPNPQVPLSHFIFSTLPSVEKISGGELHAPHFDLKAELEAEARTLDLPATFIHVAFYYDNFLSFFPPKKQPDGTYAFGFPQGDTPLAMTAVEDVGGVVAALFNDPAPHLHQTVGIVGDDRPPHEYARIMTRLLGRTVAYHPIPRDTFAALGFPGAEDLAHMFDFNRRFIPNRSTDLKQSRALYPAMQTFESWLTHHREALLQAMGE
jgi:uncharacterized protein YbjT (DUF2867 family)